jgi:hypothetical protein
MPGIMVLLRGLATVRRARAGQPFSLQRIEIVTEYVHRCDGCGDRIECGRSRIMLALGTPPPGWPVDIAIGRATLDLCPSCMAAMVEYVAARRRSRGADASPATADKPSSLARERTNEMGTAALG